MVEITFYGGIAEQGMPCFLAGVSEEAFVTNYLSSMREA
jgi:hypothetical protein